MDDNGFTLLELLISIAIISIIVSIAVPSYQNYTRRARYSEIVQASAPYKLAVADCFHQTGDLSDCNNNQYGIPPLKNYSKGLIDIIEVQQGKITITPKPQQGISSDDTFILTPEIDDSQLHWLSSGGGVERGYVHQQ